MKDLNEVVVALKGINSRRVFIQYPEGLKLRVQKIAEDIEKSGIEVVTCLEPCFGACDVRDGEAQFLGCDSILHIGHEKVVESKIPVIYWEYFLETDPVPILEKELGKLEGYQKIGLVTSIQFVSSIPKAKEYLVKKGKQVLVEKALQFPGQVLGCMLAAAERIEDKVDCFLCISAGKFYGLGLVMRTDKPVLNLDLEKGEIADLGDFRKKIHKIIEWNKAQLKDSKRIGILVSWKKGQLKNDFYKLKKDLEKSGKTVYVLAMDEITPEKLEGLKLDFLVNCVCPRIGIDDLGKYKLPLLNVEYLPDIS
jgi:2-(3-amino-3-carboxypropyl)histidine synthase